MKTRLTLALLLAPALALAQVASVPSGAGVAPAGAAAAAGASPMVQYQALRRGDIQAALNFITVPTLQEWLWASRPSQAQTALAHARRLADFGEVARVYGQAPDAMRWALLARRSDGAFQAPGTAGKWLGANPFLEGSYDAARAAYCAWEALSDSERAALARGGHDQKAWAGYHLPERVRLLREVWIAGLRQRLPETALHPDYAPVLRAFLARAGGYMNDEERASMSRDAERSERLVVRAAEMKARAAKDGDRATLEGLARVAQAGDVDVARAEFDKVFTGAGGDARATEVPGALAPEVLSAVAAELPRLVRALAQGTPAAAVLEEAESFGPLKVSFEGMPANAIAQYHPTRDALLFNPEDLAEFLRAEGRRPEELLTDRSLLARYALALGPVFVHEATHARQYRLLARRGLDGRLYQQAMEIEAFAVQGSFAAGVAARFPSARAALARWSRVPALDPIVAGWKEHEKVVSAVRSHYRRVPGSHRAWLGTLQALVRETAGLKPYARPAAAELARRSRLPVEERLRLEREGAESGASAEGMKTSILRRVAAWTAAGSREGVRMVSEANAEIEANAKASLQAYRDLKLRLRAQR